MSLEENRGKFCDRFLHDYFSVAQTENQGILLNTNRLVHYNWHSEASSSELMTQAAEKLAKEHF